MTTRNLLLFLILTIVAIVSWLAASQRDARNATPDRRTPVQSGYYILDAQIYGSDDNGVRMYTLNAGQALQGSRGDPIELEQVEIAYQGEGEGNGDWKISASNATLDEATSMLVLKGDVVATRTAAEDNNAVRLTTERLDYNPQTQVVETDASVRFDVGMGRLNATGMRASLTDNTIELRSNIRGQFTP